MPSTDHSAVATDACNASQTCLLQTYDGGEFAHFLELPTVQDVRKAVDECGDTLLTFLFVELADSEDCVDVDNAVGRVDMAIAQLEQVRDALLVAAASN